ncbi:MAG: serine/threonine protein kinase, partial [Deltaproteobacteria bacterium]|nr:serine/threonine protein kinase [Deltaproteobacteria bacterium]
MSELLATVREAPGVTGEGAPGQRYGRFVVVRLLGYGGMGAVFAARDPELDREVAIKVLHTEVAAGGEALKSEAQAMARLTHPNTVSVYEVGEAHGQAFIVMELIAGRTLRAWLDEEPRAWAEVVAMFVRAGRGLEAAHRAGIVHRDFKPENVLVDRDGWPRVCDFGLASVSFARSGGTPAYMAPEQWLEEDVDAHADQFAFAVALWRAIVGAAPFAGETKVEVRAAVIAGAVVEPPPGCAMPSRIEAALRRGLARRPADRWPSLSELLAELERVAAG